MAFNYEFPYTDPNLYNDDWLLAKMKEFAAQLKDLEDWKEEWQDEYEAFLELIRQIESGEFPDSVKEAFQRWMEQNAIDIVGKMVKMVFFGITDDGYFVAYIPESWEDIIFGTSGLDDFPAGVDYGHLTLSLHIGG